MSEFLSFIGKSETREAVLTKDLQDKFHALFPQNSNQLIHFCLAQNPVENEGLGVDGHPKLGGFLPPIPLLRRMWAGGKVEFFDQINVNEPFQKISTIKNIVLKEGKSGKLYFVTLEHEFKTKTKLLIKETQDIVYKGAENAPVKPSEPAPIGEFKKVQKIDTALLFRYSAITFNAHKIHYDRDYAREIEGYPALVVHGPLQATWLIHFAAEIRGQAPRSFNFRSASPLFDKDKITLHASWNYESLSLWTAREGGGIAMQAEAMW